jgi:hypothetical protein
MVRAYAQISDYPNDIQKDAIKLHSSISTSQSHHLPSGTQPRQFSGSWTTIFGTSTTVLLLAWYLTRGTGAATENTLSAVQSYGILMNHTECVFRIPELNVLCYQVSIEESWPLEEWVAHLQVFLPSNNVNKIGHFLAMINFYICFLPNVAVTESPLHDILPLPGSKISRHQLYTVVAYIRRVQV